MKEIRISADYIFDGKNFLHQALLVLDDQGFILEILQDCDLSKEKYSYYPGLITPGFINAHLHLELSHMKGRVATGTGLLPFLNAVVSLREVDPSDIERAIRSADLEMLNEGIVAAGDISNKRDTITTKIESPIYYYNFIEAFDLFQESMTDHFFGNYKEVYDQYRDLPKSMVPHAPYSVSPKLFQKINEVNSSPTIISIHNQEVRDENLLFQDKSGGFPDFVKLFGFHMDDFRPTGKNSVYYSMEHLDPKHQYLFVHNIHMSEQDIQEVLRWNDKCYFVSCPNANLYIENELPRYEKFRTTGAKLCLGTDSLTSNWKLSILEEIKTIARYQSYIPLEEIFRWASYNGAEALGIQSWAGSLEPGKKPGINWIQDFRFRNGRFELGELARVQKIHS